MSIANHPVNSLGGVALPRGVNWLNRYQHPVQGQTLIRMLDGGVDQYAQDNPMGRSIVLEIARPACYLSLAQMQSLQALEASVGTQYTLAWGDYTTSWATTNYTVIFDFSNGPAISMSPGEVKHVSSVGADALIFEGTINLLTVA